MRRGLSGRDGRHAHRRAPAAGYRLVGWNGSCSNSGTCRVVMTSAQAVQATFAKRDATAKKPVARIRSTSVSNRRNTARFTFSTSPRGRSARCALVRMRGNRRPKSVYTRCGSPKTYRKLKAGRYVFSVKVLGSIAKPATRAFKVR